MKKVKMIAFVATMMLFATGCEDNVFQDEKKTDCCHTLEPPKEDKPDEN